jgi:choline-glycine betaine transporter
MRQTLSNVLIIIAVVLVVGVKVVAPNGALLGTIYQNFGPKSQGPAI